MHVETPILICGANGMVGSAIVRRLHKEGYSNLLTPSSQELDLLDQQAVTDFFHSYSVERIVMAAARVGGIYANMTYPAEFLYDNIMMQSNLIHQAYQAGVTHVLFLGSTCIYPKSSVQPIKEESLLTAPLEPTNAAYALAKITGIKMCDFYRQQYGVHYFSAMPTNLYGPNDNYHKEHAHVLPTLLRRFHEAKENRAPSVTVWGTGDVYREFLYVDDLADALYSLMQRPPDEGIVNIGIEEEVTIAVLAEKIASVVGFSGEILFDPSQPEGMLRKKTDLTRMHRRGWQAKTSLDKGLPLAYMDFLHSEASACLREV